jgi:hypothetical protein
MTLTRGSGTVTARRQAAVAVLVAAAIVIGLWSAPPTMTPASVTIDLQRLPVGAAAEVSWQARKAFAGVTARGELDRRRQGTGTVLALMGVSPDGKYEVKRENDRVVWVLRSDTGYPLFDLKVGTGSIRRAAWEPDGALVLDVWHGGKAAAVRCTLAPACERAGGSTTRQTPSRVTKVTLKASEELSSGVRLEPDRRDIEDTGDNSEQVVHRREPTRQVAQAEPPARQPLRTQPTADRRRERDWMSEAVEQYLRAHSGQFSYDFDGDDRSVEERDSSERDGEFEGWPRDVDGDGDDWRDGYYGDHHR